MKQILTDEVIEYYKNKGITDKGLILRLETQESLGEDHYLLGILFLLVIGSPFIAVFILFLRS